MQINKFFIFLTIFLSIFSIPIDCMKQSSEQKQSIKNLPALFDIAIHHCANTALNTYNNIDLNNEEKYKAIEKYLKEFMSEELYSKVISYMINTLEAGGIFSAELLKLYQADIRNMPVITDFLNQFDYHAKIDIIEKLIDELSDIQVNSTGFAYKFIANRNEDLIINLLSLIIESYQNIDFYDDLIGKFSNIPSRISLKICDILKPNIPENQLVSCSPVTPYLLKLSISNLNPKSVSLKSVIYKQLCSIPVLNKLDSLVKQIRNIVTNTIIKPVLDNKPEEEILDQEWLQEIGKKLLILFFDYYEADENRQIEIEQEILDLHNNLGMDFMQKVIDFLITEELIKSEEQLSFDITDFIQLIYNFDTLKSDVELERIFIMLQTKYPQYIKLIYKNNLLNILGLNIEHVLTIQRAVSTILAERLIQLLQDKPTKSLKKLCAYYLKFDLDFIHELLLDMINVIEYQSESKWETLKGIKDFILKFSCENKIDISKFKCIFYAIKYKLNDVPKLK